MLTHPTFPTTRDFQRVLSTRPDPLNVLTSTAYVLKHAQHVTLDLRRVQTVAQMLALREVPVPAWNYDYHFFDSTEKTLTYLLLLDALNFSFWGEPRWGITFRRKRLDGYWALAAALKRATEENAALLDPRYLADLSPAALARILRGRGAIPLFAERWRNVQELGRVLRDHFGNSAARLIRSARGDAPRLARLVAENFPSFDDATTYQGAPVCFFKRAQILVADIWGSFGGKGWGKFRNLGELTAFADYKLPQILRAWGMLKYRPGLARRVNQRTELAKDSAAEIEIRAGTLWGVEFLREAAARHGRQLTSVQMDWFLWETSQHTVRGIKPYHRVRTIYY